MTVAELIEKLSKLDPKRIVVMAKDEEGNGFGTLHNIEEMKYDDGEVGYEKLTPAMKRNGYGEEDIMDHGKPCIVLWP